MGDISGLLQAIERRLATPTLRIDLRTLPSPERFAPVSQEAILHAEASLGFAIPSAIVHLLTNVGNGGFGPGAGILGLSGGYVDLDGRNLVERYLALRKQGWPSGILPLCDLGDSAWSCVLGGSNEVLTVQGADVFRTTFSIQGWLESWVAGVDLNVELFEMEDAEMRNPFNSNMIQFRHRGRAKGALIQGIPDVLP